MGKADKDELNEFILNNFKDYDKLVLIGRYDRIKELSKIYGKEDEILTKVNGIKLEHPHFKISIGSHHVLFISSSRFNIDKNKAEDNELLYVIPSNGNENEAMHYIM